jgi:xanthine dehydrogenase accessory factor
MRAEIETVLARTAAALRAGERVGLAVVVGVTGSAYRRAGAAMAVGGDWTAGGVSAGCLESDVVLRARGVRTSGHPCVVEYDTGDVSPFGFGVGCGGRVRVAIRGLGPGDARTLTDMAAAAAADAPFRWALPTGDALGFERLLPAPDHLHLYGAGGDTPPIVELASRVGLRVTVIDHRAALLDRSRLGDARELICAEAGDPAGAPPRGGRVFAVVKTHDLERDRTWLGALRRTPAVYIGLMGPAARGADLVEATGGPDGRIRAPVGLDLGGEGPAAVALSIVAELLAAASGATAAPLARASPAPASRRG